jgi:hypothetical protein
VTRAITARDYAAGHYPGTRLALTHAMPLRRRRTDLVASTPMAVAVSSEPHLSRAEHAPVSESPQRQACRIARRGALDGERAAHSIRIVLVLLTLMAAGVSSAPQMALADDSPVPDSDQDARPGAWTRARMSVFDEERPPAIVETRRRASYATELAWAYVATPALAIVLTSVFGLPEPPIGAGGFAIAMLLASTPVPLVHLLNDRPGRAIGTFLLTPALFLGGALIGTFVGLAVIGATMTRDTPDELEDGALAHGEAALAIGVTTGIVALGTWAVFDVLDAQHPTARSSRSRALSKLQIGIAPRADGAAAVLAGQF